MSKISTDAEINKIRVKEQESDDISGTPVSGYGWYYSGTTGIPYYKNDAGVEYNLTDTGGDMDNPMTTEGDLIYSSDGSGTPERLAIGTTGQFLTTDGTVPSWGDAAGMATDSLWAAEGDIAYGTGDDAGTILAIGSANYFLVSDGSLPLWRSYERSVLFTMSGSLSTNTGAIRVYNLSGLTRTIKEIHAAVNTAPVGTSILVDVNIDGTTIFTTQGNRPSIAGSAFVGNSTSIDVTSWVNDAYLTMDVDQVGSTTAGSDLAVQVVFEG